MYGKLFASCFTGSMYGAGPVVFAVWGYVLANTGRDGTVEVNVRAVANALGAPEEEVAAALAYLLAPDGESRSMAEHGRRLVQVDQYRYRVVNYETYRTIRNEDERRAYNREKQRESRARKRERQPKAVKTPVNDIADKTGEVNDSQPRIEDRGERVEVREDGNGEKGIPVDPTLVTSPSPNGTLPVLRGRTRADLEKHLRTVLEQVDREREWRATKTEIRKVMVELVFAYWQKKTGHTRAKLDPKREARLRRHLVQNNDDVSELLYAVDGWFKDETFRRLADEDNRTLDHIQNIFTDRERIERLAGHCPSYQQGEPHKVAVRYQMVADA